MEKKYLKPEIEIVDVMAEQALAASIEAPIVDDPQGNEDALGRILGIDLEQPFGF